MWLSSKFHRVWPFSVFSGNTQKSLVILGHRVWVPRDGQPIHPSTRMSLVTLEHRIWVLGDGQSIHPSTIHPSIFPSSPWVSMHTCILDTAIPPLPQVPPLAPGGFCSIFQAPAFFPDLHWAMKCSLFNYFPSPHFRTAKPIARLHGLCTICHCAMKY